MGSETEEAIGSQADGATAPFAKSRSVRQDIEILRILSAFGIVWFHSGFDGTGLGYSGLVVFLVLSVYFPAVRPGPEKPFGQILTSRAFRLLSPWVFWMAVYGVRNQLVGRNVLETDRGWVNGILAGTQIHLWYLPFIFATTIGLEKAVPASRRSWLGAASAVVAAFVLASAQWWRPWAQGHGYPSVQYCHAVAGVAAGIFLGTAFHIDKIWRFSLLAAVFAAAGFSWWKGVDGVGQTYFVGLALCSWILLSPPRLPAWIDVRSVSGCMFGVYLVHIIFDRLYYELHGIPVLLQPLLTFATSLALVWLLRRFLPGLARFVV